MRSLMVTLFAFLLGLNRTCQTRSLSSLLDASHYVADRWKDTGDWDAHWLWCILITALPRFKLCGPHVSVFICFETSLATRNDLGSCIVYVKTSFFVISESLYFQKHRKQGLRCEFMCLDLGLDRRFSRNVLHAIVCFAFAAWLLYVGLVSVVVWLCTARKCQCSQGYLRTTCLLCVRGGWVHTAGGRAMGL